MDKKPFRLNPKCVRCLIEKHLYECKDGVSPERQTLYMQKTLEIISRAGTEVSAPVLFKEIADLKAEIFGERRDYSNEKSYFNALMLDVEDDLRREIESSDDPLLTAVRYAMTGNYVDFAVLKNVDVDALKTEFAKSAQRTVDGEVLESLRVDIKKAKKAVFVLDNCGEIVIDKLFIEVVKKINPCLEITAIVRGGDIVNDATEKDAKEVGLDKICKVIGSGQVYTGTRMETLKGKPLKALRDADFILAKGQGNFETMQYCGLNVYYIFMCKCNMFAQRFSRPLYSGVLINEKNL